MGCDEKCGCPMPCPGGAACKCKLPPQQPLPPMKIIGSAASAAHGEDSTCRCGEHCECSPCMCGGAALPSRREDRKASCASGPACTCAAYGATD
ncbi:hypothetical protein ACP4OV_021395 [Aristida adscensionis]